MYDRFGRTLAYLDKADGGIIRSKRPVRVLPIPTSITAIPRPEPNACTTAMPTPQRNVGKMWAKGLRCRYGVAVRVFALTDALS